MIFVILTPGVAIDVPAFLGDMLTDLAALDLGSWYYHGSKEILGANWKVAFDGYLEGYHFATAHPKTVAPRTPSNRAHYQMSGPHLLIGFPQVGIRRLREVPRGDTRRTTATTSYAFCSPTCRSSSRRRCVNTRSCCRARRPMPTARY